jgi:NAD(P)-dependent dehydrogenase (short-subunit alcohol dehydrogenase family)
MAEGLVEAGGIVHCLDILPEPDDSFGLARERVKADHGGSLKYHQVDVSNSEQLEKVIGGIASEKQRLDGLIAGKPLT